MLAAGTGPALTSSPPRTVLHVTSAYGGGVDRYLRDVAASTPGPHLAWHIGGAVDVVEDLGANRFWPVAAANPDVAAALADLAGIVHLHGVDGACRHRLRLLMGCRRVPYIVTLHDLGFLHPTLFEGPPLPPVDPAWLADLATVLRAAAAVIAPSPFIARAASDAVQGLAPRIVPPGLRATPMLPRAAPASFRRRAPRHVVAVVGAIGPHKGSALLPGMAAAMPALDAAIVVLGYTDEQLTQGWLAPGLFVHGPYADDALPGWLAAYAPELALFPNRIPESFSYTLSEAWAAGIPAIVPDEGALGERVRLHGGGWLLPAGFEVDGAVALLTRLLADAGEDERRRVKSEIVPADPARVPPLSTSSAAIAALYAEFAVATEAPDLSGTAGLDGLQRLLAANLDGFSFRQELVRLCATVDALRAEAAGAVSARQRLERDFADAQTWVAKLEADIALLKAEVGRQESLIAELNRGLEWLRHKSAALDALPRPVRRLLLWKAARAGG